MSNERVHPQALIAPTTAEVYPLWINDEWYIPVAADGCVVGQCGEGALGFIIQLHSTSRKGGMMALKIPRMVAETHRENAYISELLLQERNAMHQIFTHDEDERGIDIAGLLPANPTFNPLRAPLTIHELRNDARDWDGALILVRYEKGHNPYFCLVKPDREASYPPQAKAPKLSHAYFETIREKSVGQTLGALARDWSQVVFITHTDEQQSTQKVALSEPNAFNITEALSPAQTASTITWYTCLPSVGYTWAPHTLQEAIGLGSRGVAWSLNQHLQLIENICNGIQVLHAKGMLHADIRPANIVHLRDPKNPERYYLSDYGSFATTNVFPVQRQGTDPSGQSIIGPVVEGERTSAFYAPERQTGRERETADTAIVIPLQNSENYYILVGWKSEFKTLNLLDGRAQPNLTADEFMDFIQQRREQQSKKKTPTTSLDKGDRIQLRDYVFELAEREEILDNMQLFECHNVFWTVYHSKIVINENKPFDKCFAFPIPRIIELPQWSAATDLYSLGVLCLYSVYSDSRNQPERFVPAIDLSDQQQPLATEMETAAIEDTVDLKPWEQFGNLSANGGADNAPSIRPTQPLIRQTEKEQNWSATDKLDEGFEAMLTYLADESLFNAVWPKIEWLRHQIEKKLAQTGQWTAESLATTVFEPNPKLRDSSGDNPAFYEDLVRPNSNYQAGKRTLRSEAEAVISQITSTVPGIEHLLRLLREQQEGEQLDPTPSTHRYQLGPFIFFIHFVLRCLHRQASMDTDKQKWKDEEWQGEKWMTVPFCQDRHEPAGRGAINEALLRLKQIRAMIDSGALKGLWTDKIAKYDLRPENEIRRELADLQSREKLWIENRTQFDNEKKQLQTEIDHLKRAFTQAQEVTIQSVNKALERLQSANRLELLSNRQTVIEEIARYFLDASSTYAKKE